MVESFEVFANSKQPSFKYQNLVTYFICNVNAAATEGIRTFIATTEVQQNLWECLCLNGYKLFVNYTAWIGLRFYLVKGLQSQKG